MQEIHHALVLNLHQPSGNLEALLSDPDTAWEAKEILFALDRIPRELWPFEDLARVHLSLSGTLLEALSSPSFQSQAYGIVDCGALLWHLQNERIIKVLGSGYYHPVFPLIPERDREAHIERWLGKGRHLFWRHQFEGFWPPEMSFCMEMIPLLRQYGYRYVVVDSNNVERVSPMSWGELRYRPHVARFGDDEIIVVVRDRELSDAQESGMEFGWFYHELHERTKACDFPPLVTTCTDGDNGGWFRNTNAKGNFWGVFYREFMNQARAGSCTARPTFIDDYLDRYGAHGEVKVRSAAWNTGWHNGDGFVQWTGSQRQKDGLARIRELSNAWHELEDIHSKNQLNDPEFCFELDESSWRILRAETSCNFYWGEAWVDRCHQDLDHAAAHIARAQRLASSVSEVAAGQINQTQAEVY